MIANNDMQGSLNIRKSLTMLQEELTDVLARVQHMKLVEAPWLHRRYVALFGAKNLHIMSLAIDVTQLQVCCSAAQRRADSLTPSIIKQIRQEAAKATSAMRLRLSQNTDDYLNWVIECNISMPDNSERPESEIFSEVCREFNVATDSEPASRNVRRRLESRISDVAAEEEEGLVSYPFTPRSNLDDAEWIAAEQTRLDREIHQLQQQLEDLHKRFDAFVKQAECSPF